MANQINLQKFVELCKREINSEDNERIQKIEISSQSIHRWLQYCHYHYTNLVNSTKEEDLFFDRISEYRRQGEKVIVRHVYEANIIAFLNSLHAMLDSFPYLLNLFIPVYKNPDSTEIKWHQEFIKKYEDHCFGNDLKNFMFDPTFNKVKGYVNTTKHKHLIRISNNFEKIEFEDFKFRAPKNKNNGKISYEEEIVSRQDAIAFINECHNYLVPKFFYLCNSVISAKSS